MNVHSVDVPSKKKFSYLSVLQWMQQHRRTLILAGMFTVFFAIVFWMLLYLATAKSITIDVDGQKKELLTHETTVASVLDAEHISLGPTDRLSVAQDTPIQDQLHVEVIRSFPIKVKVDGAIRYLQTTYHSVFQALNENGISLGVYDKVSPGLKETLKPNQYITINRISKDWVEKKEQVAFQIVRKADASMDKGTEKIVQKGVSGTKVTVLENTYENGRLIASKPINEELRQATQPQIVVYGTKKKVRLTADSTVLNSIKAGGLTFDVRKVIRNVSLTAYSLGVEHTGKTKNSPGYGETYTGTRVAEGRTVAVDPRVIPLGWWIYIEGIGLRRAEDIGSAVRGNRIDVYYDNNEYANRFGIKRGYTVYVIGPKKP